MTMTPQEEGGDSLEQASLWCFRLADGDMSEKEQIQFETWLAQSDEHRRMFDETLQTWRAMDDIRLQPDILAFRSMALETLGTADDRGGWIRRIPLRSLAAIAATVALLIIGYTVHASFQFTTYVTGTGERRVVLLEDGSRLSLDADSNVGVRFSRDRRELRLLRGRAKFDVAKDSLRPFSVAAGNRIVVATGTEFSVELLAKQVHVILYEGRVNIVSTRAQGDDAPVRKPTPELQLVPGREMVATITSDQARVQPSDPAETLSWEAGFLTFEDEPLQSAVERFNRYIGVKLAIGDGNAANVRVNGVYPAGDVDAFIEGVTGVLPLRVVDRGGVRTFVHRP